VTGLRELLDAAAVKPRRQTDPEYVKSWSEYVRHIRALEQLAPELAALCLDMADAIGVLAEEYGRERDVAALLSRLDRIGKETSDG